MVSRSTIEGAVYGMAYGDAWGYTVEFARYQEIIRARPKPPRVLVISDDTQMSIYNIWAWNDLVSAGITESDLSNPGRSDELRRVFAERHFQYHNDPDNTRAPGITVSRSLAAYGTSARSTGDEGVQGNDSKGCGTVMRAPWLGLFDRTPEEIATLAILQSQTTHGHPTSWVAAAVAALVVHDIAQGSFVAESGPHLIDNALASLDLISAITSFEIPDSDLNRIRQDLTYVKQIWSRFAAFPGDPTSMFGSGWTADEALVVALAVTSLHITDPVEAIRRLVYTDGDSDSIAAIGGAFVGAANGYMSLGMDVKSRLEPRYQTELAQVCDILSAL